VTVYPIVENIVGILVHVNGFFFARYDESFDGKLIVAMRTSDVGTVLIGLRACHTGNGPGLE